MYKECIPSFYKSWCLIHDVSSSYLLYWYTSINASRSIWRIFGWSQLTSLFFAGGSTTQSPHQWKIADIIYLPLTLVILVVNKRTEMDGIGWREQQRMRMFVKPMVFCRVFTCFTLNQPKELHRGTPMALWAAEKAATFGTLSQDGAWFCFGRERQQCR